MRRARAVTLGCAALVAAALVVPAVRHPAPGVPLATSSASSAPRPLYVYGHSWTTGYGLGDPSASYPRLAAADLGTVLHARGVNGTSVHHVAEHVLGAGPASWRAGASGDVIVQAVSNTARDHGVDAMSLVTTRNALRVVLATLTASRREEDARASHRYTGSWRTVAMPWASGGSVHVTRQDGAAVRFTAAGGEYVVLRGVPGDGATVRVRDVTASRSLALVDTGHQVRHDYSHAGLPMVVRLPRSAAGHTVALTKVAGPGALTFDARLPQRAGPGTVVLVEEPYLLDYSLSTAHPYGSDHVTDVFNDVIEQVAAGFPNATVVDPAAAGWDPRTMVEPGTTHATRSGHRFLARLVERALRGAGRG
jgi:hypothetical protein